MPLSDTTPDAEAIQIALWRRLTDGELFQRIARASEMMRNFVVAELRRQHPDWSDGDAQREFLRRQFPPDQIPSSLR
ncbi:MAG: hypothetical protein WBC44_10310 [Planctomycetaceae bacterium]